MNLFWLSHSFWIKTPSLLELRMTKFVGHVVTLNSCLQVLFQERCRFYPLSCFSSTIVFRLTLETLILKKLSSMKRTGSVNPRDQLLSHNFAITQWQRLWNLNVLLVPRHHPIDLTLNSLSYFYEAHCLFTAYS